MTALDALAPTSAEVEALDAGTELAVGWLSAVMAARAGGVLPTDTARDVVGDVAEALADALAVAAGRPTDVDEPTVAELLAIEAEAPILAAELAVVTAECELWARPSVETARRLRRARNAVTRAYLAAANRPPTNQQLETSA